MATKKNKKYEDSLRTVSLARSEYDDAVAEARESMVISGYKGAYLQIAEADHRFDVLEAAIIAAHEARPR